MAVKFFRLLAILAILSGTSLTALNVSGLVIGPDPHPLTANAKQTKGGISPRPAAEVLHELEQMPPLTDLEGVQRLTILFSSGILHYWPPPDAIDPEVFYSPLENWALFAASRIEGVKRELGVLDRPVYARLERYDYRAAVEKGVGFCSQVAMAVADFARRRGYEARIVGLDGHVVAELTVQAKTYIVDADYGVTLPHSMSEVEEDPTIITPYYAAAGYRADWIAIWFGSMALKATRVDQPARIFPSTRGWSR